MTINSTGQVSLAGTVAGQSVELELGGNGTTAISLNDVNVRALLGVAVGMISLNDAHGKSSNSYWLASIVFPVNVSAGSGYSSFCVDGDTIHICANNTAVQDIAYHTKIDTKNVIVNYANQYTITGYSYTRTYFWTVSTDSAGNPLINTFINYGNSTSNTYRTGGLIKLNGSDGSVITNIECPSGLTRNSGYRANQTKIPVNFSSPICPMNYTSSTSLQKFDNTSNTVLSTVYEQNYIGNSIGNWASINKLNGNMHYTKRYGTTATNSRTRYYSLTKDGVWRWGIAEPTIVAYGGVIKQNTVDGYVYAVMNASTIGPILLKIDDNTGNVISSYRINQVLSISNIEFDSLGNICLFGSVSSTQLMFLRIDNSFNVITSLSITAPVFTTFVSNSYASSIENDALYFSIAYNTSVYNILKLPLDGSKTGTWTANGVSYTVATIAAPAISVASVAFAPDTLGTASYTANGRGYTTSGISPTLTETAI